MQNLDRQRYVASNYHRLQGLRLIPLGLYAIILGFGGYAGWWSAGPSAGESGGFRGSAITLLFLALALILMWLIGLWYQRVYGQVEMPSRQRSQDRKTGAVSGGVGALVAVGLLPILHNVDQVVGTPVSLAGLALAAFLTIPAFVSRSEERFWSRPALRKAALAAAGVVTAVSLLPLFGIVESGSRFYGMPGVWVVFGFLLLVLAASDHAVLARSMKGSSEEAPENG